MKDRIQKQKLLQYFLSRLNYPQLEVEVIYAERIAAKPKIITDIDVMAMAADNSGVLTPILGDCKTLKGQSPINRVFWLKGLSSYFGADSGIVLLSKKIENEHQLLSSELGISLLSGDDFNIYSAGTGNLEDVSTSSIIKLENWDKYFDIPNRFSNLNQLYSYCRMGFWNEKDYTLRLRHSLARIRAVKREMNPDNNLCMFLFLELSSQFAIALNELSIKTFYKYLLPENKETFDKELKILLWGGYETYTFVNELRSRLVSSSTNDSNELSLPEWESFVNLVRSCLDKPLSTALTPIILKELAFSYLEEQESLVKYRFLERLLKNDPYASKMAIQILDYLTKGSKIPQDFSRIPNSMLMKLQR